MSDHHCHAKGCSRPCPPRHLMCKPHWFMVPQRLRQDVWATYREGQEIDKRPSQAWVVAADAAIEAVRRKEQWTKTERQRHNADALARRMAKGSA